MLPNACHHLARSELGANKNHLEAAKVNGIVSLPLSSASGHPEERFNTQSRDQLKHSYGSVCCETKLLSDHPIDA